MRRPSRRGILSWLTILVALSAGAVSAEADVIILKNGNKIRGKILSRDEGKLTFALPYGTMAIPLKTVKEIIEENDEEYLRETAKDLISSRDVDRGLGYLRKAFQENPDSPQVREDLVGALYGAAAQEIGRNCFEAAERLMSEAARLWTDGDRDGRHRDLEKRVGKGRTESNALEDRAREAREAGHFAEAQDLYSRLVENYPDARSECSQFLAEASVLVGHAALREEDPHRASQHYREALVHEPNLIAQIKAPFVYAELQIAIPLLKAKKHREARQRLLTVHDLVPDEPAVIYHLALSCEGTGDLSEAARLYSILAGPERRPINGTKHLGELRRLAESRLMGTPEPETTAYTPGAPGVRETTHFVIHHVQRDQAKVVEKQLEHHFRRLSRLWFAGVTRPDFRRKIPVWVHPSEEALRKESGAPAWAQGFTANGRRYGLLVEQSLHFNGADPQLASATLVHELAHALLPHRIGMATEVPLWVDEGVATSVEPDFKQEYYRRIVAEGLREETLIPLPSLLSQTSYPSSPEGVRMFYAQSNSVIRFLRYKVGSRPLFPLIVLFAEGSPEDALSQATRFDTVAELERAWKAWVAKGN